MKFITLIGLIFGPSIIVYLYYLIRIKLMKRRFRKEIEAESRQWKAKMLEEYGIKF